MTDNTIFSLGMAGGEALPAATIAATGIGRKTRLLTGHCGDIIAVNQSTMPARVLALSPPGPDSPTVKSRGWMMPESLTAQLLANCC